MTLAWIREDSPGGKSTCLPRPTWEINQAILPAGTHPCFHATRAELLPPIRHDNWTLRPGPRRQAEGRATPDRVSATVTATRCAPYCRPATEATGTGALLRASGPVATF